MRRDRRAPGGPGTGLRATDTHRLGLLGERIAARWLAAAGWTVVARRFRAGHRDLDLVVRREGVVAFVEVKTRLGPGFGDPVEAVDWRKRRALVRCAEVWIDRCGRLGESYRFDVVGVVIEPAAGRAATGPRVRVRHVVDAFGLPAES